MRHSYEPVATLHFLIVYVPWFTHCATMAYMSLRCVPRRGLHETDVSLLLAPAAARTPSRAGCGDVTGIGGFAGAPLWQAQFDPSQLHLPPLILLQYPCSLGVLGGHCFSKSSFRKISLAKVPPGDATSTHVSHGDKVREPRNIDNYKIKIWN